MPKRRERGKLSASEELTKLDDIHSPEAQKLIEEMAENSTHGDGDQESIRGSGNRLVLGPYSRSDGYIQEALNKNGQFFDMGNKAWTILEKNGIDPWLVNEKVLQIQLEAKIPRVDFMGEDIFDVINSPDLRVRTSFRAQEINWLLENAEIYGYIRDGTSWALP